MAFASSNTPSSFVLTLGILLAALLVTSLEAKIIKKGLSKNFYSKTCPKVFDIVSAAYEPFFIQDATTTAPLIRLPFHDCWDQSGCDASLLLAGTKDARSEQDADTSATLGGFDIVGAVKSELEKACPRTVSCADLLILLGREATIRARGPYYDVLLGRRDGTVSYYKQIQNNFPSQDFNVSQLIASAESLGLNAVDLVATSGAHTVGQSHCSSFIKRIYPKTVGTLQPGYGKVLRSVCPPPNQEPDIGDQASVNLDLVTPNAFDNQFFKNILIRNGLLNSDQELLYDKRTGSLVRLYAKSQAAFFKQYVRSIKRLSLIDVLVGNRGTVRVNCSINNFS